MSLLDALAAFFAAHPHQWIDGRQLGDIAGSYAWRTRVADCRKRGLRIENRQRRQEFMGQKWTVSEYRYVPEPVQREEAS